MLIIIFMGLIVSIGFMVYSLYAKSHYPKVEGTIVNTVPYKNYSVGIAQYYVNGVAYQARTSLSKFLGINSNELIGKKIMIHYNPKNPQKIVEHDNKPIIVVIFFVVALITYILVEGI